MNRKGAIFDLDGTLLDSMPVWDTIGEDYLRLRGIEPEPGLNEKFKTWSIAQAADYYIVAYGLREPPQTIIDGVNRMIERQYTEVVQAKPGVVRLLESLKARGVPMCVATATDRHLVEAALRRNRIDGYFSAIVTCAEVGAGKDRPDIFERARFLLGTQKAATWVFEDAPHAIRTAKEAGFRVAGVFDRSAQREQDWIRSVVDCYIENFETLKWSDAE